jgi:hypothetical protein
LFNNELFLKTPYSRFREFVSEEADRFAALCSVLDECSLRYQILEIENKRHIAVPGFNDGSLQPRLIVTAHYDRAPRSPGANDNGAAVFQLVDTVSRIVNGSPVLFIFTDGEELSKGESIREQGSYGLGLYLKKNGLGNSPIFTFDAGGTGDTLIISTTADQLLKNENCKGSDVIRRKSQALRRIALEAARRACLEKVLLLPTPFSEDAGFLLSGMTAQTITVLPHAEAALVRGGTSAFGLGGIYRQDSNFTGTVPNKDRRLIPETWRILNGPGDSPIRLTPLYWKNIPAFIEALAKQ